MISASRFYITLTAVLVSVLGTMVVSVAHANNWRLLAGFPDSSAIERYEGTMGGHIDQFAGIQCTGIEYHAGIVYVAVLWAGRIYKYSTSGALLGEIVSSEPYGLAFDTNGYMYVTELSNQRVVKFNPDGSFNSVFAGGLINPRGICTAPDGKVYVACYGSSNVRRFTSTGTEITPALQAGSAPMSVACGPDGYLYVGASSDNTLRQVNVGDDTYSTVINVAAYDLEIGPDGNLYVTDLYNYRIGRVNILSGNYEAFSTPQGPSQCKALGFYPDGGPSITFTSAIRGSVDAVFYNGSAATVDVIINNLYESVQGVNVTYQLLDYKERIIWSLSRRFVVTGLGHAFDTVTVTPGKSGIFKLQAAYTTDAGPAGTEDLVIFGSLPSDWRLLAGFPDSSAIERYDGITRGHIDQFAGIQCTGIEYHAGIIYVTNLGAGRIYKYSTSGALLGEIVSSEPYGLAFDTNGYMYVTELSNQRVVKFNPDGSFNSVFAGGLINPRGICTAPDGKVYVACYGSSNVRRFTSTGTEITPALQAGSAPMSVACGPDGYLYVGATSDNTLRRVDVGNNTSTTVANVLTYDLEIGPDDNLYVADLYNYKIGRFSILSGQYEAFSTPPGPSQCKALGFFPVPSSTSEGLDDINSPLGIHTRLNPNYSPQKHLGVAKKTGMKWVRLHDWDVTTYWTTVEPVTKGQFNFIEESVNNARANGLSVLGMLEATPRWASSEPTGSQDFYVYRKYPANNINDWRDYVTAVVRHYKDRIHYWEVGNESDLAEFWMGTPEQYAEYVRVAYQAAKAEDPTCTILAGGLLCWDTMPWTNQMFATQWTEGGITTSVFDYIDILAFHYSIGEIVPYLKDLMMDYYGDVKPMWSTENAVSPRDSQSVAASDLIKLYTINQSLGVQKLFYYYMDNAWAEDMALCPQALWTRDGAPTSKLMAYATLSHVLSGATFAGSTATGNEVHGYVYQKGTGSVAVLWSEAAGGTTMSLNSNSALFVCRDIMGNVVALPDLDLNLTTEPFYLICDSMTDENLLALLNSSVPTFQGKGGIVVGTSDGNVVLVSGKDLREIARVNLGSGPIIVGTQPDGDIVAARGDGMTYLLSGADLSQLAYFDPGYPVTHLAVQQHGDPSCPGGNVVVARNDGYVWLLNGNNLSQMGQFNPSLPVTNMALQPDGDVVVARSGGYMFLINGIDLSSWVAFWPGNPVIHLAIQSDGDVVIARNDNWTFLLSNSNLAQQAQWYSSEPITDLAVRPDDDVVVVGSSGHVYLCEGSNLGSVATWNADFPVAAVGIQSDGDLVVARDPVVDIGVLFLVRGSDLAQQIYMWGYGYVDHILVQPDGNIIVSNAIGDIYQVYGNGINHLTPRAISRGNGTISSLSAQDE